MNCVNCYKEIPEDASFCPYCGAKQPDRGYAGGQENPNTDAESAVQNQNAYAENKGSQYSQSNQPYYDQYNQGNYREPVNWVPYLVLAIFSTLCCCVPFGIVGIVYAVKINMAENSGDIEGTEKSAKLAKIWIIASIVTGVIVNVLLILLYAGVASYYPSYY